MIKKGIFAWRNIEIFVPDSFINSKNKLRVMIEWARVWCFEERNLTRLKSPIETKDILYTEMILINSRRLCLRIWEFFIEYFLYENIFIAMVNLKIYTLSLFMTNIVKELLSFWFITKYSNNCKIKWFS